MKIRIAGRAGHGVQGENEQDFRTSEATATNSAVSFQSTPGAANTHDVATASLVPSVVASEAVNSLEQYFHNDAQKFKPYPIVKQRNRQPRTY